MKKSTSLFSLEASMPVLCELGKSRVSDRNSVRRWLSGDRGQFFLIVDTSSDVTFDVDRLSEDVAQVGASGR